jgi:hypothetical protein
MITCIHSVLLINTNRLRSMPTLQEACLITRNVLIWKNLEISISHFKNNTDIGDTQLRQAKCEKWKKQASILLVRVLLLHPGWQVYLADLYLATVRALHAAPSSSLSLILNQYCAVDKIEKNEMGGAYSSYGGEERCVQGSGGETWGKETTRETQA